ncbi:hypothetical protein [Leptospira fluminis]|nr:hypothetical protein [Leptospira fluminis]
MNLPPGWFPKRGKEAKSRKSANLDRKNDMRIQAIPRQTVGMRKEGG